MADFDHNPRGGLTANRDSLHASVEYRRQVAAMTQMKESEVDEKMTLTQVGDEPVAWQYKRRPEDYADEWKECDKEIFDTIRRTEDSPWAVRELFDHAQPAQAVDVAEIREVIARVAADNQRSALTLGVEGLRGQCIETAKDLHKLTRAIDNAQDDRNDLIRN